MANRIILPTSQMRQEAYVGSMKDYNSIYQFSVERPATFWSQIAEQFYWKERPESPSADQVLQYNFDCRKGKVFVKWFEGWKTNICYNVLDRAVEEGFGRKVAYLCEGNDLDGGKKVTYGQLLKDVCRFANVLKECGVQKGVRVAIYMPMTIEQVSYRIDSNYQFFRIAFYLCLISAYRCRLVPPIT